MMMETGLFVRKAQQSDILAILEIEWECFREDSFSKEQFAYLISRSKGTFYVMMEGDTLTVVSGLCTVPKIVFFCTGSSRIPTFPSVVNSRK